MLEPLTAQDIYQILQNALNDKERGLADMDVSIDEETLMKLSSSCSVMHELR